MLSSGFGRAMRSLGQAIDRLGVRVQGEHAYIETFVPSTRVVAAGGELQHGLEGFISTSSNVIGAVQLGEKSSVWYGASVRGDKTKVTIGRGSCVQDRAVVDGAAGVTTIGNDVTIGAGAFVGGATISDGVLVGPGAKVLAGAHVGSDSYIDGGAVVTSGTRIPAGELWTGSPAAKLRNLTEGEIAYLRNFAQHTAECAETHFQQSIQTRAGIEQQEAEQEYRKGEFMTHDAPLPEEPEELLQYNRLSYNPHDVGMFRAQDYDEPAEWAKHEAIEDQMVEEADAEGAEYAIMDRVNDAVEELLSAHPARHDEIIATLRDRDAKAADILEGMMSEVAKACEDATAASALEATIRAEAPGFSVEQPKAEAKA